MIYWNVAFEKYWLLNFVRLLCEFGVENSWKIWLSIWIDYGLSFHLIWGGWLSLYGFTEVARLPKRIVLFLHDEGIILIIGRIIEIPKITGKRIDHFVFILGFNIDLSGNIVGIAIMQMLLFLKFLLRLLKDILICFYF